MTQENSKMVGVSFFELIEFSLVRKLPDGKTMTGIYGVNVAKVREVVHMTKINPLASSIEGLAGIFELRGVPIPAINLNRVLGDKSVEGAGHGQIIVTEFSCKRAGFMVHNTRRIRKVGWDKVLPPSADSGSCMSGMILIEDNEFLFILDLERILHDIELQAQNAGNFGRPAPVVVQMPAMYSGVVPEKGKTAAPDAPWIMVVDDSRLMLDNIAKVLQQNGYQVIAVENGMNAFNMLKEIAAGRHRHTRRIDCIVTDVEMPLMDGFTLTMQVRKHAAFSHTPIVLHSSLNSAVTVQMAEQVGATTYVVKNDINKLLSVVKDLVYDKGKAVVNG